MSFFDNHYLFSETYIKEYIEQQKHKDITGQDILNKYKTIKEWHDECSDTNVYRLYPTDPDTMFNIHQL